MRVHPFELLGSSERKWRVAGVWKRYPVELQDRARLHFSLYLLSCGICATEDTGAAGPSTVDSKYLYLQQSQEVSPFASDDHKAMNRRKSMTSTRYK